MSSNHKKGAVETYEVEKIVDEFFDGKKMLYQVKWQGYADKDNTWEPLAHLQEVPEKVKEWEQLRNSRKHRKSWQEKVELKCELKYMPKVKKSETSRVIRKEKQTKKTYGLLKPKKVVDKVVSIAKKSPPTKHDEAYKLVLRSKESKTVTDKEVFIDKRNDLQKLIDNKMLRKDLGLQKINMAKDSVVIIVEESLSEVEANMASKEGTQATKQVNIPLSQRRAISHHMKQLIKSSKSKLVEPEVIDIEQKQSNQEQKQPEQEEKQDRQVEEDIIRSELDSIPQLPKMAEQINQNNINFFFQEPAQGLMLEDPMNYTEFEQILKIYKEDGIVLCEVSTKDGQYAEQVSYELLQKKRSDLLHSFFEGRYPFK